MMKLRINPKVEDDLKNIKKYISMDNEKMANKIIKDIFKIIEQIQRFPYMGANLSTRVSFKTEYKYVVYGNYIILYKIEKEYIGVYRIINRHQDLTDIF